MHEFTKHNSTVCTTYKYMYNSDCMHVLYKHIMTLTFSFATFVERHLLIRRWIFLRDLETWENRLPRDLQWPPARNGTWAIAREMISPVIYTNTLLASSVSSRLERGTDSSSLPNIYFGLIWYDTDIFYLPVRTRKKFSTVT